jgi:hypothetical protein
MSAITQKNTKKSTRAKPQRTSLIMPFVKFNNLIKSKSSKNIAQQKKRKPLKPKLRVSIGTLIKIEMWVSKAETGNIRYTFGPILDQIRYNGDVLEDVIQALTLAQIMPYREIKRCLGSFDLSPTMNDYELTYNLAQRYKTSQQNVVERIDHVRMISRFLDERKSQ